MSDAQEQEAVTLTDEVPKGVLPDPSKAKANGKGNGKTVNMTAEWTDTPSTAAPIAAIIDHLAEYERGWLKDVFEDWRWDNITALPPFDRDGNPHQQAMIALHCYLEVCAARKGNRKDDPVLLKAEATEWERFTTFDHAAKGEK